MLLYDYPASPGGLATQGELLYRGLKEMGVDAFGFNNYGSSLIFGHPQGPTATRLIIEGIEETVMAGGGYCLWTGCAAGDCGAALILKIS